MTAPGQPHQPTVAPLRAYAAKVVDPATGRAAVVMRLVSGAASADFQLDPDIVPQWAAGLAQALTQAAADAQQHNGSGLAVAQSTLIVPEAPRNGRRPV